MSKYGTLQPLHDGGNLCTIEEALINQLIFYFTFLCLSLDRLSLPSKSADWTHFGGKHLPSQEESLLRVQFKRYLEKIAILSQAPFLNYELLSFLHLSSLIPVITAY